MANFIFQLIKKKTRNGNLGTQIQMGKQVLYVCINGKHPFYKHIKISDQAQMCLQKYRLQTQNMLLIGLTQ